MTRSQREGIMLAYPTEEGRVSRLGEKFFCQPKLNGERCRVEWFHGEPVLMSSYANVIKGLEHIEKAVLDLNNEARKVFCANGIDDFGLKFDGELYIHGWTWSQIVSVTGRTVNAHPKAREMQYHIFDIQEETAFQINRFDALDRLENVFDAHPCLVRVPTYVTSQNKWTTDAQTFVDDGYEGIILRAPFAPYHYKRNVCLLKYKPTESDTYEIVDVLEAISQEGEPKGMVGAFLVRGNDGTVFKVGAGKIPHKRREVLWQKRQFLTSSLHQLHVKHEKLRTINDVPVAAVAVDVLGV